MKKNTVKESLIILFVSLIVVSFSSCAMAKGKSGTNIKPLKRDSNYLANIIAELQKKWPTNRTINLVFHGHSVPSGYQQTPLVTTFGSYPLLSLKFITEKYPFAVINAIKTSIGGENSEQGAKRFKRDVLTKEPDVIFIDYALNDRKIGLARAKVAWEEMIKEALAAKIKLILLTPTPDATENIEDPTAPLAQHTRQILALGERYQIPVVDSYDAFKKLAMGRVDLKGYMAQNNHVNPKGHAVVAKLIAKLFEADKN